MSFIAKYLNIGENIVYRANLHWVIFLKPMFFILLTVMSIFIENKGAYIGYLFLGIAVFLLVSPLINYFTSEFAVTNKRVIIKVGFIERRSLEILLPKVEAIHVDQSIIGRILGFGTITITGTGGMKEPFHGISSPLRFRQYIQGQII